MERIGVRALRDGLSAALRRVAAGESIEVTDHGKVVARLVPAGMPDHLARLIEEGAVTPAASPLRIPSPSQRIDLGASVGEAIIADREDRI